MKGLIPIGGRGTRMRPLTYATNKHFIPVANRPLIEYPIKTLVEAGVSDIGITYNPGQLAYAREVLGDGSKWGAKFTYILQPKPRGLANIVEVAEKFVGNDRFVLHLGDNIFTSGVADLVKYFSASELDGIVTMVHHKDNRRLGVPYFDDKGNFLEYVEKPENPPNDYGIPGLYFFSHRVFDCFKGKDAVVPSARGELEIGSLYNYLQKRGYKIEAREYKGVWLDPGKFDDWLTANRFLLDQEVGVKVEGEVVGGQIEGRVEVEVGSVLTNCIVRGPVRIGKEVKLTDSFIGPFSSIYDGSEIIDCRIENSVVMGSVKLKSVKGMVVDSIIGEGAQMNGEDKDEMVRLFLGQNSRVEM